MNIRRFRTPHAPGAPYVIEAWLRADVTLKGSVVHERLVAEHGFTCIYQRVKVFLAEARPGIAAEHSAVPQGIVTRSVPQRDRHT